MFESIPEGLATMPPGPELAVALAGVDVRSVSGYDRVVVLAARQRQASHDMALVYDAMEAVADHMTDFDHNPEFVNDAATAEIRVALRLTRRAADAELGYAMALRRRLPRVWGLLAAGEIDPWRARVIVTGVCHLPVPAARAVVDQIAEVAPGLTTGQLRVRIRRLCIEVDPDDAADRYTNRVAERRVVTEPTDDGTANLFGLDLPPDRVAAASRRINDMARTLRRHGELRTMDQLRADVLLDLLCGTKTAHTAGSGGGRRGIVDITVDLATLTGLTDTPGELGGYGPVIADIARRITQNQHSDAEWRYTVTHPDTGMPIHTGTTRRRPTASQRRAVEARDRTCVFPGCRMPAVECDLDHRTPWAEGGPTTINQLDPLCRHDHHTIRHQCGWTYQPLPNGDYLWTTKLGHTYTTSGRPP